jgi:hypothetical protein
VFILTMSGLLWALAQKAKKIYTCNAMQAIKTNNSSHNSSRCSK